MTLKFLPQLHLQLPGDTNANNAKFTHEYFGTIKTAVRIMSIGVSQEAPSTEFLNTFIEKRMNDIISKALPGYQIDEFGPFLPSAGDESPPRLSCSYCGKSDHDRKNCKSEIKPAVSEHPFGKPTPKMQFRHPMDPLQSDNRPFQRI